MRASDDARRRWLERGPLLGLAALTALCGWIYAGVFRGEPVGDDNTFHLAEVARLAECLAHGDLDLWNPSGNLGFADGYYYQVVAQLVPALAAAATGGHVLFWFQVGVVLPLVLAPAAAYRALRLVGATGWQALGGATALAMCVSGSQWGHGADGVFLVGLYTQAWALAALPLALAWSARWLDTGRGGGAAVAWGIFVGLCHPFAGIALGVAVAAGELARQAMARVARARGRDGGRPWVAVRRLAWLGGLLLAGSACGWVPVLVDYDGFGGFPHRVAGEAGTGLIPLVDVLSRGRILDEARPPVLTFLLPLVLLLVRAPWLPRLWAAAAAYALFLAIGPALVTPDDLFPAVRFFGALQVVLALAAGAGAVALVELAWRRLTAAAARGAVAGVAAVAIAVVLAFGAGRLRARVRVADDEPVAHRRELEALLPAIAAAPPGREQARAGADAHWLNLLPYVYAGRPALLQMGGAALQSSPSYVFLWELRDTRWSAKAARIFDAPLVLVARDRARLVGAGRVVAETEQLSLIALPAPGLVSPAQIVGTLPPGRAAARAAALRWLASDESLVDRLLAYDGHGGAGPPPAGRVTSAARRPPGAGPDLVASVEAEAPTTFVVRESWHPRWYATIDGAPAPVRRVTPDMMAVDVAAGAHAIALEFDRPWWALALWLLWPAAALVGWRLGRRGCP